VRFILIFKDEVKFIFGIGKEIKRSESKVKTK
jgi:hypothetical protein